MEQFKKMMEQIQDAQAQMKAIQSKLAQIEATAEAGAGAVRATINGNKSLTALHIAPEYINAQEPEILQDLIIAAVNMANRAVEQKSEAAMKAHTQDMLGGLPDHFLKQIMNP